MSLCTFSAFLVQGPEPSGSRSCKVDRVVARIFSKSLIQESMLWLVDCLQGLDAAESSTARMLNVSDVSPGS